jgi:hypothetical protein
MVHHRWRNLVWVADKVCAILISMTSIALLVSPMVALTYISSVTYMLVAVSLFSASLGFVVAITVTRVRNQDIFALTAAYAAVLVVFVGNLLQRSPQ